MTVCTALLMFASAHADASSHLGSSFRCLGDTARCTPTALLGEGSSSTVHRVVVTLDPSSGSAALADLATSAPLLAVAKRFRAAPRLDSSSAANRSTPNTPRMRRAVAKELEICRAAPPRACAASRASFATGLPSSRSLLGRHHRRRCRCCCRRAAAPLRPLLCTGRCDRVHALPPPQRSRVCPAAATHSNTSLAPRCSPPPRRRCRSRCPPRRRRRLAWRAKCSHHRPCPTPPPGAARRRQ